MEDPEAYQAYRKMMTDPRNWMVQGPGSYQRGVVPDAVDIDLAPRAPFTRLVAWLIRPSSSLLMVAVWFWTGIYTGWAAGAHLPWWQQVLGVPAFVVAGGIVQAALRLLAGLPPAAPQSPAKSRPRQPQSRPGRPQSRQPRK